MKLLIVEDNEITAELLDCILSDSGHTVMRAPTGETAWQLLASHPDIGLVIIDIKLPDISGIDLLERMRQSKTVQNKPVILCSATADANDVRHAARLGCRHFLIKPVDRTALLQKIREAMEEERPVLWPAELVMQKYGLNRQAYQKISQAFGQFLREHIQLVEQKLAGQMQLQVDLAKLNEEASILGAERLLSAARKMQERRSRGMTVEKQEYEALCQEMKDALKVLSESGSSEG